MSTRLRLRVGDDGKLRHTPSNVLLSNAMGKKKEVEEAKVQPEGALQPLSKVLDEETRTNSKTSVAQIVSI